MLFWLNPGANYNCEARTWTEQTEWTKTQQDCAAPWGCNTILCELQWRILLLFLLLVVHQAGTETALLSNLHAILVTQLVGLLHELLHLLHDSLVLLLILLLGGLLRLLVAGRIVGRLLLLRLLRGLIPRIGYFATTN